MWLVLHGFIERFYWTPGFYFLLKHFGHLSCHLKLCNSTHKPAFSDILAELTNFFQ